MNISVPYSIYGEHAERVAVKVVDKGMDDEIREIPPKEIRSLQVQMSELCGIIFVAVAALN